MALSPCDFNYHRYPGKACHVYIGVYDGVEDKRTHLRVCPQHLRSKLESTAGCLNDATGEVDYDEVDTTCVLCHGDVTSPGGAIFVTYYATDGERHDAYASIHPACVPQARVTPELAWLWGTKG